MVHYPTISHSWKSETPPLRVRATAERPHMRHLRRNHCPAVAIVFSVVLSGPKAFRLPRLFPASKTSESVPPPGVEVPAERLDSLRIAHHRRGLKVQP